MNGNTKPIILGTVYECDGKFKGGRGAVYDKNSISPTIVTMSGGINHSLSHLKGGKY